LVSVAAAPRVDDDVITNVAITLGGVAQGPWRAPAAEEQLRGTA